MAYRSISVWLEDILIFIDRIKKYVDAVSSFEEYQVDEKLIDAVERNFEKISEALKNALQAEPDLPISEGRKIIDFRNFINHQYYQIEQKIIWAIIKEDLPLLETEVRKILEDYERRLELNEL